MTTVLYLTNKLQYVSGHELKKINTFLIHILEMCNL